MRLKKELRLTSSTLILTVFVLLVDAARKLRGEKQIIVLLAQIYLTHLFLVSVDISLYGFLVLKISCLLSNLLLHPVVENTP